MKWWNQRNRKRDGWVERKRRFQKMLAGKLRPVVTETPTTAETAPKAEVK